MNKTTNITCPKCGENIPLSEAISHSIEEELQQNSDAPRTAHVDFVPTENLRRCLAALSTTRSQCDTKPQSGTR